MDRLIFELFLLKKFQIEVKNKDIVFERKKTKRNEEILKLVLKAFFKHISKNDSKEMNFFQSK